MSKTVNNADQINAVITTNGDATASVDFTPTQDTHVVNKAYVDSVVPNVANHSLITNGGFDVWQRGTVFNPVPVDGYTADRWVCLYAGTSPSVSKNTSAGGNALLITGVAGNTGTTVDHRIEQANVKHLNNGGNVTLSFG